VGTRSASLEALSRRELFTGPDDRVFPAPLGGPFNDQLVRDAFYAALDAAGLGRLRMKDDPVTFHDLRHTFGSLAVRVAEVPKVQMWMGHANIATTMIYVHAKPQHDDAAKLAAAFALEANPLGADSAPAVAADAHA
jgi:integrase